MFYPLSTITIQLNSTYLTPTQCISIHMSTRFDLHVAVQPMNVNGLNSFDLHVTVNLISIVLIYNVDFTIACEHYVYEILNDMGPGSIASPQACGVTWHQCCMPQKSHQQPAHTERHGPMSSYNNNILYQFIAMQSYF